MFNNVILYAGNQTDKVLIKQYYDVHTVGIFRVAEEICSIVMEFVWPVERALYAGYAKQVGNLDEIRKTLLKSVAFVAMIGLPLSIALLVMAEPAVHLLLGPKGLPAVPFVQVLCLHSALRSSIAGILPVFMPLGRPQINTQVVFSNVTVRLALLFLLFPMIGVMAAPWSLVAGTATGCVIAIWQVTHLLQLRWYALPLALWRTLLATGLMFGAGHWSSVLLKDTWTAQSSIATLLIQACLALAVFFGALFGFWRLAGRPDGPESQLSGLLLERLRRQASSA